MRRPPQPPAVTATIDMQPADQAIVTAILRSHLPPEARAWVFGSRATGTARRYSDLDLALEASEPLDADVLGRIADALCESDLPYKVDLLDLRVIDPSFRTRIARDFIALPLGRHDA